ncbi:ScbR family autoregulator-binding transcription factor [Streptomyces sp. NPDC050738]|uniref:ScbR family autoregulator-binding transcription factor n=1 Tax=Streptomyces sp. NPDC050738 TaxID=3154744 RepID=UPI003435F6B3
MGKPKQERAVQTRESLLRAAAEVFDESGFSGATISSILKRAGVTAGALYFHFDSKEALARAVMTSQPQSIVPLLESEGLQRLIDLTMLWSYQLQVDPILRAGVRLATEHATQDKSSYEEWREIMQGCLQVALDKGELQAGIVPDEVAEFVVGACTGIQMYADVVSGRRDLPDRTRRMWQLLMPGIAMPAVVARTQVRVPPGFLPGAGADGLPARTESPS